MSIDLIWTAPTPIQIHLATVAIALVATAVILPMRKGTALHRIAGRIWAGAMLITAVVTFWIDSFETALGLNPIHLFSAVVLISVPYSIWAIRRGRVRAHAAAMKGVLFGGLGVAGTLAFMPGRLMHQVLFG